jgi:hypothetical protein
METDEILDNYTAEIEAVPEKVEITLEDVARYRTFKGKIDPITYCDQLKAPLHSKQKIIAKNYVGDPRQEFFVNFILSARRWGKSYLMKKLVQVDMLTPNASVALVTAGSLRLAKKWLEDIYFDFRNHPAMKDEVKLNRAERTIKIPRLGSSLIVSSEQSWSQDLIGSALVHVYVDEACLWNPNIFSEFYELVTPTGLTYGREELTGLPTFKMTFITTPRGSMTKTPQGRLYAKGLFGEKGFKSFKFTIYDNPMLTKEDIETQKVSVSPSTWNREFMCEWEEDEATVLHKFNISKHIIDVDKGMIKTRSSKFIAILGVDIGFVDGAGIVPILYDTETEKAYVAKTFYKKGLLTSEVAKELKATILDITDTYGINTANIMSFVDPSRGREFAKQMYVDYGIDVKNAPNSNEEGYNYTNELFEQDRLFIDSKENEAIRQWTIARFKEGNSGVTTIFEKDDKDYGTHFELVVTLKYACLALKRWTKKTTPILV